MLEWVFRRCDGAVEAIETPIGLVPAVADLDIDGLDIDAAALEQLLTVDESAVKAELPQVREHLAKFGSDLPGTLRDELEKLEARLG